MTPVSQIQAVMQKFTTLVSDQSEMQCASSTATNIRCLLTYLSEDTVYQGFVVAASGDKNTKVYKVRFYPYSSGISLTKLVFTTDYIWQIDRSQARRADTPILAKKAT